MSQRTLYLHSQVNSSTGWGQWMLYVAWYAAKAGWSVYCQSADFSLVPIPMKLADPWLTTLDASGPTAFDVAIVCGGNHYVGQLPEGLTATRLAVATFFEDALIRPREIEAYQRADAVLCGSDWNRDLLRAVGVAKAQAIYQGIDTTAWFPRPRLGVFGDRRVIFSGGKLEQRKGQDIMVAAFRDYLQTDPEALLVTAWQHQWPATLKGIDAAGYVKGWPAIKPNGHLAIVGWLGKNGIPAKNCRDVGLLPNWALPPIIAECTRAIFPSRAEGGTNVPAMECVAMGLPTFATGATGTDHRCGFYSPFAGSGPVAAPTPLYRGTDGWRETTPDAVALAFTNAFALPRHSPPDWAVQASAILSAASGQ